MRKYEIGTAAAIITVAVIAMVDSWRKAGWTPTGPDTGFYPFWSAAVMAGAATVALAQAARRPPAVSSIFESAAGVRAFLTLVVPMVLATALIAPLGLYIASGAYMGYFAKVVGRYRWVYVFALTVGVPLALYFGFERAFRFSLPKSVLYAPGILPI